MLRTKRAKSLTWRDMFTRSLWLRLVSSKRMCRPQKQNNWWACEETIATQFVFLCARSRWREMAWHQSVYWWHAVSGYLTKPAGLSRRHTHTHPSVLLYYKWAIWTETCVPFCYFHFVLVVECLPCVLSRETCSWQLRKDNSRWMSAAEVQSACVMYTVLRGRDYRVDLTRVPNSRRLCTNAVLILRRNNTASCVEPHKTRTEYVRLRLYPDDRSL